MINVSHRVINKNPLGITMEDGDYWQGCGRYELPWEQPLEPPAGCPKSAPPQVEEAGLPCRDPFADDEGTPHCTTESSSLWFRKN